MLEFRFIHKVILSTVKFLFLDSGVGFISLDSDNESEGRLNLETGKENETAETGFEASQDFYFLSSNPESTSTFSGKFHEYIYTHIFTVLQEKLAVMCYVFRSY